MGVWVLILFLTPVLLVAFVVARTWIALRTWFAQRAFDFGAPIRRVRGPFVLVLRSFKDRMAYVELQWTKTGDEHQIASPQVLSSDVFGQLLASCHRETFFGIGNERRLENLFLLNMPREHWFPAFKILAKHAKAILILPENTAGLLSEVAHVVREHPAKVTVLMPSGNPGVHAHETDGTFVYTRHQIDRQPAWETASKAFDSVGISLPPYDPSGAFLRVGTDGELKAAPLPWSGGSLARLLDESDPHGDAQAALRELRSARIPLVSIGGRERPAVKIPGNLRPSILSEQAVENSDQLSPYEQEKRRQQAALRMILQQLSPTADSLNTDSERAPTSDDAHI